MDKQISKLKLLSFIFGLILVVQIVGMVLFFRNSNQLHSASIKKINSLVNEVGDLKEENFFLKKELELASEQGTANTQTIQNVLKDINASNLQSSAIQKYQQFLQTEKNRLENEKMDLNNQLNQKDSEIKNLKETKEVESEFKDFNEKSYAILILGENQKLTDTIILAVSNPEKEKVTLLSIPRDLFYEGRKINEYYEFYGIEKITEIVQKITGIKADKYVVFNFQSFVDLVNSIGGVDVEIDKKITDTNYPTSDKKYKTVVFEPGIEKMDGERALEYARSRKSTSDFDRSTRQQKIMIALKEKLKSIGIIQNIQMLAGIFQNISNDLQTDFSALEAIQKFDEYKNFQISAGNILSNENFLYSSKSSTGQSILLPKSGNFLNFKQRILEII